jgi:hypothetical protein
MRKDKDEKARKEDEIHTNKKTKHTKTSPIIT